MSYGDSRLPSRIWKQLYPCPITGCWLWGADLYPRGYGRGYLPSVTSSRAVHVITWTALVSPVPDGLELDHLCRQRSCANPSHLEPVTHEENVRRGAAGQVNGARIRMQAEARTHCGSGHAWTEENTRQTRKGRACRQCERVHGARKYARTKADPERYTALRERSRRASRERYVSKEGAA